MIERTLSKKQHCWPTRQRFVRLCAGRASQLLNVSSLAADCGISHTTARQWIPILQAGFILHLLPPHITNFSKGLRYFISLGPPAAPTGTLIHGGNDLYKRENFSVIPWFQVTS